MEIELTPAPKRGVVDVTSLFTVLDTQEARVYIPNNTVLTNVIKQYKHQKP
ncbi:MAG: hypothetical protein QXH56_08530 [Thermoprotei archaeon]